MTALGARLHAQQIERVLEHIWETNRRVEEAGGWPTPICLWGHHGIGKTMLVEQLARAHGMAFAYCAPAQFEEMGDLNGMPVISESGQTTFAPPQWVPTEPGPGVLLLDDLNRADDRILRGLMQLLQTGGLVSWRLPPGWQIVATANPDDAHYSVTAMDDAMLTRFRHVTMTFDVSAWAVWARDNDVDARGIDFVLGYPEITQGRRTTPRSLTAFFAAIAPIADLQAERQLVQTLALSSLDDSTVAAFMAYLDGRAEPLPSALEILESDDFAAVLHRIEALGRRDDDDQRVDQLNLVCTRLAEHLLHDRYVPTVVHEHNLTRFLLEADLPNDMRMAMHRRLVAEAPPPVQAMVSSPTIAKRLLLGM